MRQQELGFDVDHNLIINSPKVIDSTINNKLEVFKNELQNNSKINSISASDQVPGSKIVWNNTTRQIHERQEESVIIGQLSIDHDFIETYQIKLLAGRNFRLEDRTPYGFGLPENPNKEKYVMVNKAAALLLGYGTVEDALNKKITFQLGPSDRTAEIIGVTDNFHQQSLQNNYEPILYLFPERYTATSLTINMNTMDVQSTLADIEKKYTSFFPMDPFKYEFLDDHFNLQYQEDLKFGQIFLLFSGLAIFIAALGLFGLGSYMAMRKTKELCIRKVLGASIFQVLILIPKSLIVLVLISGIIAIPVTYYIASQWLSNYAFQIQLNPLMFITPLTLVIIVAAISVLPESIKVALLNSAKYLRNE